MATLLLLGFKISCALGGFVGVSKVMEWYNTDKKGGKRNGGIN